MDGTGLERANAVIADWGTFAFVVRSGSIQQPLIDDGRITLHHSIFYRIGAGGTSYTAPDGTAAAIDDPFSNTDPMLRSRRAPLDIEPTSATGPTNETAVMPPSPFDATATFLGAMRHGDRWTDGWTRLP